MCSSNKLYSEGDYIRPIIQVALDLVETDRAVQIAKEAVEGGVDCAMKGKQNYQEHHRPGHEEIAQNGNCGSGRDEALIFFRIASLGASGVGEA